MTEKNAIMSLPDIVSDFIKGDNVLILCDNNTFIVAGARCQKILSKHFNVSILILLPAETEEKVYAEENLFPLILRKLKKKDVIITVGSGTITDLGKYSADKMNIPLICVPTAPSMNAYTSGVAAFISKNLKKTVPVKPATAVLTDIDIISQAPLEMIKSGFADSLARSFANADWKLSSFITGENFCDLPFEIAKKLEADYIGKGTNILKREKKTIVKLMESLHLGGLSMVLAGSSSPASGGEHLISHFLDMVAHRNKKDTFSLHGLQVGLGIIVSATIYERLKEMNTKDVEKLLRVHKVDYDDARIFIRKNFRSEEEFNKKLSLLSILRKKLPFIWDDLKQEVFPMVVGVEKIKHALKNAGCPIKFSEIGVDRDLAYNAIKYSRFVRNRLTILDVAGEIGILPEIARNLSE